MSRHRFFLTEPLCADEEIFAVPLFDADLHHAVSVLRIRPGEELDLVEPDGRVVCVTVADACRDALLARHVREVSPSPTGGRPAVTLVFGISKGSKNDEIVEGAVEVGVSELVPVLTARTVVKLDVDKRGERSERWQRIARAAAKQSKRDCVPAVQSISDLADQVPLLAGYDVVLVAWEDAASDSPGVRRAIADARLAENARVAVVVGPEGGLTEDEVGALLGIGARTVTLGDTILRAETAAVVSAALVLHELGELGNRS